jgi:uncharacterized membrane protein
MAVESQREIQRRPVRNPIRIKRQVKSERVEFGRALRRDGRPSMRRRRAIVALSFGSIGALGVIGLYQFGITPHVPDPPLRRFRADAVSASGDGYIFQTPDAVIGMASYAVTAVLAAMGPPDRAERRPWQPLLMAGKVAVDAANALRLTGIQVRQLKFFCAWCLTTSALTLATVPLALPETREAFRTLRRD